MVNVRISTRCYPTEDRDKVLRAVANLFPDCVLSGDELLQGESSSLEEFAELLSRQRIRDSARSVLRRGLRGDSTSFRVNKQVASVGKVSFSEESHPLGDIDVTISDENIMSVIDMIAPNTRKEVVP
jgi:predicted RNA binding protein with dsRBD fold (UPF0201 family)